MQPHFFYDFRQIARSRKKFAKWPFRHIASGAIRQTEGIPTKNPLFFSHYSECSKQQLKKALFLCSREFPIRCAIKRQSHLFQVRKSISVFLLFFAKLLHFPGKTQLFYCPPMARPPPLSWLPSQTFSKARSGVEYCRHSQSFPSLKHLRDTAWWEGRKNERWKIGIASPCFLKCSLPFPRKKVVKTREEQGMTGQLDWRRRDFQFPRQCKQKKRRKSVFFLFRPYMGNDAYSGNLVSAPKGAK